MNRSTKPARIQGTGADRRSLGERELLTMTSAIMAMMALAIDMMLPAFDEMRREFGLAPNSTSVAQVITFYFFGLAVAQLFWGPLADRFGRKPILYAGIALYLASAVGSALSPNLEMLLFSRFMWGIGAAGSRVVATAIVRDCFEGSKMAKALSQIMAVFMLVPVFAPSLGAGLIAVLPWQSIFWFCAAFTAIIALWSLRLPETLAPANKRDLQWRSNVEGFRTVASTRVTAGYTVATTFLQGVFVAYLATSELIVSEIYDRRGQFPFIFGAIATMFGLSALVNGRLVGSFGVSRVTNAVLRTLMAGALLLLVLVISTDGQPPFWLFMPSFGVLLALFMFLMPNLNTGALAPMGELAGTAASLTGAFRTGGGALLGGLISSQMNDTVTPFVVGFVVMIFAAAGSKWFADHQPPSLEGNSLRVAAVDDQVGAGNP